MPVTDAPEDKWHRKAFEAPKQLGWPNGTYELVGEGAQGNVERVEGTWLVPHAGAMEFPDAPRTFGGLREWLAGKDIEGLV